MLGAIIGDIAGSIYEWDNIKTKDFPLLSQGCFFTDDTVMTIAIAEANRNGGSESLFIDEMKKWGRKYPDVGYGRAFRDWLFSEDRTPYHSWGNGSAMRVSSCAWYYDRLDQVEEAARRSAAVTHNHPEGIKGAQALAAAIFLARTGEQKEDIKRYIIASYGYDLERELDAIRPSYSFEVSCQKSVPEAILAFLESRDFEDAIRNAISLGGDSDTLSAMAGSIAEAAYGIPESLEKRALAFLDQDLYEVVQDFKIARGF